jgi:hypothetical protein
VAFVDDYHFGNLFALGLASEPKMGLGKHRFCDVAVPRKLEEFSLLRPMSRVLSVSPLQILLAT